MPEYSNEEEVKIKFLLPYLRARGYKDACFAFGIPIVVQQGRKQVTIYPDVVVYATPKREAPLILCETKGPNEILDRPAKEQGISYARLLPRIAPLVLLTNGSQVQVFQTLNKNRIAELPHRSELTKDLLNFIVSQEIQDALREEAKHELFIIDDVRTFKSLLSRCHTEIRNNEGYDATEAFDEMSKVLFCKLYEEKEHPNDNRFRLSLFDDTLARLHVNIIQTIFEDTKGHPSYKGLFEPGTRIELKDRTIRRIVQLFENYDLSLTAFDVKGEAFEHFLSDTFTAGLGEFFTPRNIVEFMVDIIDPRIGEKIIDMFCGTGGFLIYAFEVVGEKIRLQEFSDEEKAKWKEELSSRSLYGTDWKERTSQACKMNMMVHGDGSAGIIMHDGLTDVPGVIEEGLFNLCLTNPPFGSYENDPAVLKRYDLGAGRQSQARTILALERAIRLVRPGGRIAIVIIDGVLNTVSTRYVREYLKRNAWIKAVISLAPETFQGYGARAKTSVLILERKAQPDEGKQDPVFMAIASNTGYAPNGLAIPGNQLPDILMDCRNFIRHGSEPSQHKDAWVVKVGDRLDAEFYGKLRTAAVPTGDVTKARAEIRALLTNTLEDFTDLESTITALSSEEEFEAVTLGEVLEQVSVSEKLANGKTYRLLGVKWWGKGTFIRDEKQSQEIKSNRLQRVSAGWIVYNRLFAFRGSFAIVAPEHEGCYVSKEFPTFQIRKGIANAEALKKYIVYTLNSPQYLNVVDALSTGSTRTSRNRFNEAQFLELRIDVPKSAEGLQAMVALLDSLVSLRDRQEALRAEFEELTNGLSGFLPIPKVADFEDQGEGTPPLPFDGQEE